MIANQAKHDFYPLVEKVRGLCFTIINKYYLLYWWHLSSSITRVFLSILAGFLGRIFSPSSSFFAVSLRLIVLVSKSTAFTSDGSSYRSKNLKGEIF